MLFDEEEMYPADESPVDNTEIKLTYLYLNQTDMKEFKELCKAGMKIEWPEKFQEEGNVSDLIFKALKKLYGKQCTEVGVETPLDGQASGSDAENNVP